MHIKLFVSAMIAALLWTGNSVSAPVPTEARVDNTAAPSVKTAEAAPTPEDAQAIALAHAGFTADQVTRLHTERDFDDGVKEFEVEFRNGDWEYDYTIHAGTLEILKHSKEYDPPKSTQAKPAETAPTETKPAGTEKISAEEAKSIALAHAGLTADQVNGLQAEFDRDDGTAVYEVEFRTGNWEYDYEIHAESGKIREWDKDWDD